MAGAQSTPTPTCSAALLICTHSCEAPAWPQRALCYLWQPCVHGVLFPTDSLPTNRESEFHTFSLICTVKFKWPLMALWWRSRWEQWDGHGGSQHGGGVGSSCTEKILVVNLLPSLPRRAAVSSCLWALWIGLATLPCCRAWGIYVLVLFPLGAS